MVSERVAEWIGCNPVCTYGSTRSIFLESQIYPLSGHQGPFRLLSEEMIGFETKVGGFSSHRIEYETEYGKFPAAFFFII